MGETERNQLRPKSPYSQEISHISFTLVDSACSHIALAMYRFRHESFLPSTSRRLTIVDR